MVYRSFSHPVPKGQPFGQRPATEQGIPPSERNQNPATPQKIGEVPQAPQGPVTFYKGLLNFNALYNYSGEYELFSNPDKLQELNANIFGLGVQLEMNPQGQIRYPLDFPNTAALDARIGAIAQILYGKNIRIWLAMLPTYKEKFTKEWGGEPKQPPKDVFLQPNFYTEYDKAVVEIAKIAQKYHLEMFSPYNELDGMIALYGNDPKIIETIQRQTDAILPRIKEVYQGKIFYKGDLQQAKGDLLSFKGYDVLGFVPGGPADSRNVIKANIANARNWAQRDQVPEVIVAEFGTWGPSISADKAVGMYQMIFAEAKDLNGIFAADPPPNYGASDYQSRVRTEIQNWFGSVE